MLHESIEETPKSSVLRPTLNILTSKASNFAVAEHRKTDEEQLLTIDQVKENLHENLRQEVPPRRKRRLTEVWLTQSMNQVDVKKERRTNQEVPTATFELLALPRH